MSARGPAAEPPPPRIMVVSCPELRLEQMIAVVTGFCPNVEAVEPGVCAFGARGPARYFGGEAVLAARIIAAVADLGAQAGPASPTGYSPRSSPPAAAWPTTATRCG